MGGASITITRGSQVISLNLKDKKSYISFDCSFGEEYTYNAVIRLGSKIILEASETHTRVLPTESAKVNVNYKPSYYTLSTSFTHTFEGEVSKERYEGVEPKYRFKESTGFLSNAISKDEFEKKRFEYDTKYIFDVYTYFECSCTTPEYIEAFDEYKTMG